jgi:hypothetical protein
MDARPLASPRSPFPCCQSLCQRIVRARGSRSGPYLDGIGHGVRVEAEALAERHPLLDGHPGAVLSELSNRR